MSSQGKARLKLAVLVTCHNRIAVSERTLPGLDACLRSLPAIDSTMFVVDDGSSDGTGARLKALLPDIVLEYGSGDLFWNGGMCRAYEIARGQGSFDAYLLFNDDVVIDCQAVSHAFDEYRALNTRGPTILAGATRWFDSNAISYSGFRRTSRISPLSVERVLPDRTHKRCDSFNGNFALIPGPFFEKIGGLDRRFRHVYGDIDLGYVAAKQGVPTYLASAPIGQCDGYPVEPFVHALPPWLRRWIAPWPKGDSLGQRAYFIGKHAPAAVAPLLIGAVALIRLVFKTNAYFSRAKAKRAR